MRTSLHHQPEAQHPESFSYPQAAGDYPIYPSLSANKRTSRQAAQDEFAWWCFLGQSPLNHHCYGDGQCHGYQAVSQCTFIRSSSQGKRPAHSTHDDLPDRGAA